MSQRLISHSPDLQRLREEGYDIELRSGHILVKSVPYVTERREVARGVLISVLTLAGDVTVAPGDHVVMFSGEFPCRSDGTPIESIRHSSEQIQLGSGLVATHRFSNRPTAGPDKDYYEKMMRYINILSGPAAVIDPTATAKVAVFVDSPEDEEVFAYIDTASSEAEIGAINEKLSMEKLAIVGLGGVGSYVLDLVAKTPVKEIHLFDGDLLLQHNAFRSPGAPSVDELRRKPFKVDYFSNRYSAMRRGVIPHAAFIDLSSVEELRPMGFVFLCLDRGISKREVVTKLLEWRTPFVDAGMGIDRREDGLAGVLRVTTATSAKNDHAMARIPFTDARPDADYSRNIQISDLNALVAALTVMRWKKYRGFYHDLHREHHSTYTIDTNALTSEELP